MKSTLTTVMVVVIAVGHLGFISGKDEDEDQMEEILTKEQIAACRKEAKYDGNFNETTHELKCFISCGFKTLEMMDDKGSLNEKKIEELFTGIDEDKTDFKEFNKNVLQPCIKEVIVGDDNCENAFNYMWCGIKRTIPYMR